MNERIPPHERDVVARLVELAGSPPSLDPLRRERLEAAVRPTWQRAVGRRRRARAGARLLAVAAGVLVMGIGATVLLRLDPMSLRPVASLGTVSGPLLVDGKPTTRVGLDVRPGQQIGTEEARVALELRDGAAVRLDRQSRLRMVADRELVLEQGAVYVDTDGGSGRGLRIVTPLGAVEDIGTRFEVRVGSDQVRVRVRDGIVVVRRDGESWGGRAGEELTLEADAEPKRTTVSGWGAPWDWTLEVSAAGDFDGVPLADFLSWAARESGTELRFADEKLAREAERVTVHGDVSGLPLRQALATVLPVCGLAHELVDGELRLAELSSGSVATTEERRR